MKVLNRSNITFFIAVIVLTVMIICTKHYALTFLSDAISTAGYFGPFPPFPLMPIEMVMSTNPFIDVVILFTSLFIMGTFFFSDADDKQLRIFLWGLVLTGFVIQMIFGGILLGIN